MRWNEFLCLLSGLKGTLVLSLVGSVGGGVCGLASALMRVYERPLMEVIRGG